MSYILIIKSALMAHFLKSLSSSRIPTCPKADFPGNLSMSFCKLVTRPKLS